MAGFPGVTLELWPTDLYRQLLEAPKGLLYPLCLPHPETSFPRYGQITGLTEDLGS